MEKCRTTCSQIRGDFEVLELHHRLPLFQVSRFSALYDPGVHNRSFSPIPLILFSLHWCNGLHRLWALHLLTIILKRESKKTHFKFQFYLNILSKTLEDYKIKLIILISGLDESSPEINKRLLPTNNICIYWTFIPHIMVFWNQPFGGFFVLLQDSKGSMKET